MNRLNCNGDGKMSKLDLMVKQGELWKEMSAGEVKELLIGQSNRIGELEKENEELKNRLNDFKHEIHRLKHELKCCARDLMEVTND